MDNACSDTGRGGTCGANTILTRGMLSLRLHALFITIILLYAGAAVVTAHVWHVADRMSMNLYYSQTLVVLVTLFSVAAFTLHGVYVMVCIRPDRPLRYAWHDLTTNYLTVERFFMGLPVVLFLPAFMSSFSSFKAMIAMFNPFSWDVAFDRLDVLLHGGHRPWELMQPVLGYPLVTSIVNFFYHLWFFVMFGVLFWQAFSLSNPRLRMQYLMTFLLSWILLGTVLAILFSSAGPCYYGRLPGNPDAYEPLMKYLWSVKVSYPVWALDVQEGLWEMYQKNEVAPLAGISAMPSMHISSAFLFALVGWRTHRYLGILLGTIALLIAIGCVHLGWHYAVDAYAAIIGTWLLWWIVGRVQQAFTKPDTGI